MPAKRGACRLCLAENVELVESHIYPRWVAKDMGPVLLKLDTGTFTPPTEVRAHGVYDHIVCANCEQSFGGADTYACTFFRQLGAARIVREGIDIRFHAFDGWDQQLLREFFLICLFRAHVSERRECGLTRLGPRGEVLRSWLAGNKANALDNFEVTLLRPVHAAADSLHYPVRGHDKNWIVGLPGVEGIINPSGRRMQGGFRHFALTRHPVLYLLEIPFARTQMVQGLFDYMGRHGPTIQRRFCV